jgi:hypothetical protein
MNHTVVDHATEQGTHFGNGHRTRKRRHNKTIWILVHRLHDLKGFPELSAAECRFAHGSEQIGKGSYVSRVQTFQRIQTIIATIM